MAGNSPAGCPTGPPAHHRDRHNMRLICPPDRSARSTPMHLPMPARPAVHNGGAGASRRTPDQRPGDRCRREPGYSRTGACTRLSAHETAARERRPVLGTPQLANGSVGAPSARRPDRARRGGRGAGAAGASSAGEIPVVDSAGVDRAAMDVSSIGQPARRSSSAVGTRTWPPISTHGIPSRPFVSRNRRVSAYTTVRPMRSTRLASITVRNFGMATAHLHNRDPHVQAGRASINGQQDTTRSDSIQHVR